MKSKTEIWKDVHGFEGRFQVSSFGRIKSLPRHNFKKERIRKPVKTRAGYLSVSLRIMYKSFPKLIHRLVAQAFILNPDNKPEVNHINGIKTDNSIENLEWCTRGENNLHAFRSKIRVMPVGDKHHRSKLTEAQVIEIRSLKGLHTTKKIAEMFGAKEAAIKSIIHNSTWKHLLKP